MNKKGLIPFSWEEVKVGDRIVHVFTTCYGKKYICYLGKVTKIDLGPEYAECLGTIETDNCDFYLSPDIGSWKLRIDRRNIRQRFISLFTR